MQKKSGVTECHRLFLRHEMVSNLFPFLTSISTLANDLPMFASYYALLCTCYCFSRLIGLFSVT